MQTRMRLVAPSIIALTDCRFGSNRRGPTLCAWEMVRPTTGPFPQISHRLAMNSSEFLVQTRPTQSGGTFDFIRWITG